MSCAVHEFPVPTVVAISAAFLSLLAQRFCIAAGMVRSWRRLRCSLAMMAVGVSLWTIRSRVDEGQDIALLAASAEFRDDPAVRIIGDVANIPALNMPKDVRQHGRSDGVAENVAAAADTSLSCVEKKRFVREDSSGF